jgi:type I restriction enzyme R subunit
VQQAPNIDLFRQAWIDPAVGRGLLEALPDGVRSALLVRSLDDLEAYDLYDVLAHLGYGLAPRTRLERAAAFAFKHEAWLGNMPRRSAEALRALASQFGRAGTDGLENPHIFDTPDVLRTGGLAALRALGKPADVLRETKVRIFAT